MRACCMALEHWVWDPPTPNHMLVKFLTWCRREDTENIGMMELHVIPNVCSEYSEQSFR